MKGLRVAVAVVIVVLWGFFVPLAMAVDNCAAMSGMCEGPCGASSTAVAPTVPGFTDLVHRALSPPLPATPQPAHPTLERPPKSPSFSA